MRSSLACLGLIKSKKKDKGLSIGQDEIIFGTNSDLQDEITFESWNSGVKSNGIAPQLSGVRYFSFEELKLYTNNFSESNLIGEGGFGKTYKGYLPNGAVIAIKRATRVHHMKKSNKGLPEFKNEIELLSRVHHMNIARLLGFCFEQGELILVYEYISKGSLHDNLHGKCDTYLDWIKRLEIALDVARGLAYLHELANPQIIHRDVKSINILLDENRKAKLIGFGLSKSNSDKREGHVSSQAKPTLTRIETAVKGTFGYLDPEYFKTQQLSEKSDVYNFGVVMLELITAKKPLVQNEYGKLTSLIEEVMGAIDESDQEYYGLRDLIDRRIVNQARNIGLVKFVQLALACIEESGSDRPSMYEVMKEIDVILQNDGSA